MKARWLHLEFRNTVKRTLAKILLTLRKPLQFALSLGESSDGPLYSLKFCFESKVSLFFYPNMLEE